MLYLQSMQRIGATAGVLEMLNRLFEAIEGSLPKQAGALHSQPPALVSMAGDAVILISFRTLTPDEARFPLGLR